VTLQRTWDTTITPELTSLEICAGAGGQALGLEWAGFEHVALVELDKQACATLRHNRPHWNVIEKDVREISGYDYHGVDLIAGGVPCPPFSVAGHKLGQMDERDLFPEALRLVAEAEPRAVMLENVRGLMATEFEEYREQIKDQLRLLGYPAPEWRLLNASDYGVPQLRPRAILVALRKDSGEFHWPEPIDAPPLTVGEALYELMAARGWSQAASWAKQANTIAPTLVGGSHKHGGPDLGPTRARQAWLKLGVNGGTLAEEAPDPDFEGTPRLTVQMAAVIQGFPVGWHITGRKTAAYRQVGNAFPPPVAEAVARSIHQALAKSFAVELVTSVA
jgi:DNA (cytosine-5)-methyltransferase 1